MLTRDMAWIYSATGPFASSATLTHGVTVTVIYVVFKRAGAVVTVGGVDVQTTAPTARCKATDVASAAEGDTLAVGGVTYYVIRTEPLNTEETLIYLSVNA